MTRLSISTLGAVVMASLLVAACKPKPSAEHLAACEGPPLASVEKRQAAMEAGTYNRRFDCVDKVALAQVKEQKARFEAANTPEARAQREAEFKEKAEEAKVRAAAQAEEDKRIAAAAPKFVLRRIEINTATEQELTYVPSISADVAAQIVEERAKGRFKGWEDVVRRVVALSQAQSAAYASWGGLTVNGESLSGAPADERIAAGIAERFRKYK
jgi:DNA uptake protein ComE-like DNA-binding protein